MTRLLMIALLAVSVSSCGLTNRLQLGGDGGGPGRKTVSAKEEPLTLVALDGTECTVTSTKFNRTKIGDMVWCAWRSPGGARPPGGVGGPVPIGGEFTLSLTGAEAAILGVSFQVRPPPEIRCSSRRRITPASEASDRPV